MKRIVLIGIVGLLLIGGSAFCEDLATGLKASDWVFQDAEKNEYAMTDWEGKVLLINYVDPDESDLNEHLTDAMKQAKDDGRLVEEHYKGIGIADCAATWKPNFAIRAIAGRKAKKYGTTILFDYEGTLREAWGLSKDTSNIILLDKNRICRAIIRGRVPDDKVEVLVKLAVDLQLEQ